MERGVKLGADVPYCIMRGTVLAEGIGEELSVLPAMPKCTVLIAKPPISVSTKMVYEALDSKEIVEHPDIDGILEGLQKGDLHKVADSMGNVLEDVTIPMHRRAGSFQTEPQLHSSFLLQDRQLPECAYSA